MGALDIILGQQHAFLPSCSVIFSKVTVVILLFKCWRGRELHVHGQPVT